MTNRTYITNDNLVDDINVAGAPALSLSYTYDDNKNVTAETFNNTGLLDDYSFAAAYDTEDRLIDWDRNNGDTQDWNLSLVGDWDTFTENGVAETRTHNDVHELTAIASSGLTYDPKGNLTADTDGHAYAWDFDNMLTSATVAAASARGIEGTHSYEYDALGRRVAKVTNDDSDTTTVVTRTLYINRLDLLPPLNSVGGQVLAEYEQVDSGNITLARTYTYGENVDDPLSLHSTLNSQPSTHYYHTNRVYNIIGLTDENDDVTELYTYTPYGEVDIRDPADMSVRSTSAVNNTYAFTGRRLDHETGLHYFRARYMDTKLGRFINRDPLEYVDGGSLYSAYFVPNGSDPLGKQKEMELKINVKKTGENKPRCTSQPGGRQWKFSLNIKAPCNGFIIQKVSVGCDLKDCDGNNVHTSTFSYWEAWRVSAGRLSQDAHPTISGEDSAIAYPKLCREFNYTQGGEIRFYCNTEVGLPEADTGRSIPGWTPFGTRAQYPDADNPCNTSAGALTSSNNEPKFWSNESTSGYTSANRNFWMKSTCCPKKQCDCKKNEVTATAGGTP